MATNSTAPADTGQQELFRQNKRGGRRRGAGRKPKDYRAGAPHQRRPVIKPAHVLHVTLRVHRAVGSMRRRSTYKAMRVATAVAAARAQIRIVHLSIQQTHVHLLVEADSKRALARGMQSFQISAARRINTALGPEPYRRRRGQVFVDRYFVKIITSPRQTRNTLSYVLNNWRKHREDQSGLARDWLLDPFSSAVAFTDWRELAGQPPTWTLPPTYEPLVVEPARSRLLTFGWKLHGQISLHAVPSRPH